MCIEDTDLHWLTTKSKLKAKAWFLFQENLKVDIEDISYINPISHLQKYDPDLEDEEEESDQEESDEDDENSENGDDEE